MKILNDDHLLRRYWLAAFMVLLPILGRGNELDQVRTFKTKVVAPEVVLSDAFASLGGRKLPYGYALEANSGRNGIAAVVYERANPADYALLPFPLPGLKPGTIYEAEVWVRGENLKPGKDRNSGGICIDSSKNGKFLTGIYPTFGLPDELSWKKLTMQFSPHPEADSSAVVLYLRKGYTGRIYFCDLAVREKTDAQNAIILNRPDRLTVIGDSTGLQFTVYPKPSADSRLWITVKNNDKVQEFLLKANAGNVFVAQIAGLQPGPVAIQAKLADLKSSSIVYGETFELNGIPASTLPPGGAARIDEDKRLLVDGTPFMPIGMFSGGLKPEDLKRLSEAGFNTMLLYGSTGMELGGKAPTRMERLKKSLDAFQQHGMKLIFSLKDQYPGKEYALRKMDGVEGLDEVTTALVSELRNHPALLAWYLSDEDTRGEVPGILRLRRLVSQADPWHPTYVLTFRPEDFPYYAAAGDITGVDNYPIVNDDSRSSQAVSHLLDIASVSGNPVWAVPQVFNWGVYRAKTVEEFQKFRFPSAEEIRTMALQSLVHGAKGIIFYHYADIFGRAEKFAPGSSETEWPKIVATVQVLKMLEPFVMSTAEVPELHFTANRQVEGRAFRDGQGRVAVVLCGVGPGENKAVFKVGTDRELRSFYGHTRKVGPGQYEFSGKDIASDILITE
jgi:hypothetical protein